MNCWSRHAVSSMTLIWFAVLVVLVVGIERVGAFSLAGASRGLVIKKATVAGDRRNTIPMQLLSHPQQRHQQRRSDDVETSLLPVGTDTRRSTASSSRSQLYSQSSGGDSEKNRNKQNIRVLGRLSVSGLLAYGYMQYWAVVTFGSGVYYLFQKTAGKRGFQNGEWVMVGGILIGLTVLKQILGPAKFALELVVTSFFSYLFITLAQGDI